MREFFHSVKFKIILCIAALLLGLELDAGLMQRIVRGMAAEELKGLSEGLERRTAELFAPEPQMTVEQDAAREQNSAFLI